MEYYNYIKSLHLIFVITWFAGLFYIPRLFIYHIEASHKPSPEKEILSEQLKLMSRRLWYIITWPSAILTGFFAIWMLIQEPSYLQMPWMHVKLSFVFALYFYHYGCHVVFKQQQKNVVKYSPIKLRIWNELATILLFAIVFIVVLKSSLNWIWGVVGIILFGILMMLAIKLYKKIRQKRDWDNFEEELLKNNEVDKEESV